jgi:uncharacterized protein with GYD domain
MAHFIILWKFTEQGIRTVKDSAKRSETFKNSIEKAGGEVGWHILYVGTI